MRDLALRASAPAGTTPLQLAISGAAASSTAVDVLILRAWLSLGLNSEVPSRQVVLRTA
jgi:hypothetical protein